MWVLYIIETKAGKLYTGITKNLEKRFMDHLTDKKKGAKFFNISPPKKIVYKEFFSNRSKASKRECEIKKLSRQEKLCLIKDSRRSNGKYS